MKKRWLGIFLIAMMLVSIIPATAFADDSTDKVAQIGDVKYDSIQEAVNAANDGDTIVVIASHNLDCSVLTDGALISINTGKNITIDLNGKTITADYSESADPGNSFSGCNAVISVEPGSNLTLKDSSADHTGTIYGKTTEANRKIKYGILLADANSDNEGAIVDGVVADPADVNYSLVVEGGNYKQDYAYDNGSGVLVYAGADGIVLIRGGNFYLGDLGQSTKHGNGYPWIFNASYSDANRVIVTGGTFNADVNHQYYEYEVFVPKTNALKANSDGKTWTVVDSVAYVDEHHRRYPVNNKAESYYKRQVGYATLEEAVIAANSIIKNETDFIGTDSSETLPAYEKITLIKDCNVNDTLHFEKDTAIDLNNKKLFWNGANDKAVISFDAGITVSEFNPSKDGYTFLGWFTDSGYANKWEWDFDSVQGQTSLYAKWEEIPAVAPTLEEQGAGNTSQQGHSVKVAFEKDDAYTYSYQWYTIDDSFSNGEEIEGATEEEYTIPTDANVGIYHYYCTVKAKRIDNGLEDTVTSDIITVHLYKAPTAEADLVYNGADQNLVKPGETAEGKTLEYALEVEGENATPSLEWSRDIPKAKDADEYTVYYRIAETQNSRSNAADSIKVTIDKKAVTITPDDKSACINFAELPAFTYTVEGLTEADTLVKEPDITCDADNMIEGTYAIKAANADAGKNYKITYADGALTVKVHEDNDKDHICDFGCGTDCGICEDKDKDHYCDYGCGKVYGEHKAASGKTTCAYCGKAVAPKTGDENSLIILFVVMLLSVTSLLVLLRIRKRYE